MTSNPKVYLEIEIDEKKVGRIIIGKLVISVATLSIN
jgi:hypothetical protein